MTPLAAVAAEPETWKVILNKFQAQLKLIWARISGKYFWNLWLGYARMKNLERQSSWQKVWILLTETDLVIYNHRADGMPMMSVDLVGCRITPADWLTQQKQWVLRTPKLLKQVKFTCSHQSAAYVYKINKCPVQNLVSPVFFHPTAIWSSSGPIVV